MKAKLIYSPEYDLISKGVVLFHPFDGQKYSRAWAELEKATDIELKSIWVQPEKLISDQALLNVHTSEYLSSLNKSSAISSIIEIPLTRFLPNNLLQNRIIKPMKLACQGTRWPLYHYFILIKVLRYSLPVGLFDRQ